MKLSLAVFAVLVLLATACGTRDPNLAAQADPDSQAVAFDDGSAAATTTGAAGSTAGSYGDGFGTTAGTTAPGARPSTVTGGASAGAGATATTGATAPTGGARPSTTTGASAPSGGSAVTAPSPAGTTPGPSSTTPTDAAGGEAAPAPAAATGCTASKPSFKVGYIRTDAGGVGAVTGSSVGASTEAQEREWQALFEWARDTGGMCGAEIETVGETLSATSSVEERLALCVRMTEDAQIDFMIDTTLLFTPEIMDCFAQHGVPMVSGVNAVDREYLATIEGYGGHGGASLDRLMLAAVEGGNNLGYFEGATVGVVLQDAEVWVRAYETVMAPALSRLGIEPVEVVKIAGTLADAGTAGTQAANGVVAMRTKQVTHVIMVSGIVPWLAWANQAESQGWRPRYLVGEYQQLAGVTAFYGPHAQLHDAVAAGASIATTIEVPEGEEPQPVDPTDTETEYVREDLNPGYQRCLDVLSEYTDSNYYRPVDNGNSLQEPFICDHFFLMIEAGRHVTAPLAGDTWGGGLANFPSYQSVLYDTSGFSPGVLDGAETWRAGLFHDSAHYYVATTDWQALPR